MNDIKHICKNLRLAYVADIYTSIEWNDPTQYLTALLQKELDLREQAKAKRLIKKAGFPTTKTLASYEWNPNIHFPAHLNKEILTSLAFIKRHENLILSGSPGTGKSHLGSALGRQACEQGYEVRFFHVSDLVSSLERLWKERKLETFRNRLKTADLIILDEMGYVPFSKDGAELLFQLVTDWYEKKSLIITSNLEFSQWNRIFVDSRLTAALVDRVVHHAHIITFTGDSYRVTHALSRKNK